MKQPTKGRPQKPPTTKPSLRIDVELWQRFKSQHKGKVNQMFNEWVRSHVKEKE